MTPSANPVAPSDVSETGFITGTPRFLVRAENLAILAASMIAYRSGGGSWIWFAVLFLLPDLSLLAYLAGSLWGARGYNLFHSYIGPALLGVLAWLLGSQSLALLALIWVAHIGLDRVLGFGLKYGTGFGDTHLGRIGRRKALSWPCG